MLPLLTHSLFRFNVLSKVVSDIQQEECDSGIESWRHEIEISVREYVKNYYPHGVTTVSFVLNIAIVLALMLLF